MIFWYDGRRNSNPQRVNGLTVVGPKFRKFWIVSCGNRQVEPQPHAAFKAACGVVLFCSGTSPWLLYNIPWTTIMKREKAACDEFAHKKAALRNLSNEVPSLLSNLLGAIWRYILARTKPKKYCQVPNMNNLLMLLNTFVASCWNLNC
jgi:hypothetical protein